MDAQHCSGMLCPTNGGTVLAAGRDAVRRDAMSRDEVGRDAVGRDAADKPFPGFKQCSSLGSWLTAAG